MPDNLENSALTVDWKNVSFHSNPKERQCQRMFKLPHNCIHFTSKLKLKILQARLQQYVNRELQVYKLNLEKAEGSEIKLPTSSGSWKKQENSRKISASASLTTLKVLTVWITTNCGKFLNRNIRSPYLRNLYAGQETMVRTRHETMD